MPQITFKGWRNVYKNRMSEMDLNQPFFKVDYVTYTRLSLNELSF